jgi:hypothetical protein
MFRIAAILALSMSVPATGQEGGPEGPETIGAIVSRKPVDGRLAWRPTGTKRPLRVDYDRDGVMDVARMVNNGRQTAVLVTSGRTGRVRTAWLIDDRDGLGPDAYLEKGRRGSIVVIFPESTMVTLFLQDARPMATYMNG